jgi:PAS domain S-box-containing protein
LTAFAAFCLLATFGTIYAVRLHVEQAMVDLQRTETDEVFLEQLRLTAREWNLDLRDATASAPHTSFETSDTEAFFDQVHHVARFTLQREHGAAAERMLALAAGLRDSFDAWRAALAAGDVTAAQRHVQRIDTELIPALNRELRQVRATVDASQTAAVDGFLLANTQVLILAAVLGVAGVVFLLVSIWLIRRWILVPVHSLEAATHALGRGDLDYRVDPVGSDELGQLGNALNTMAERLTRTQAELSASEAKYRALFENLRDATVICDEQGRIVECQDGDTSLLQRQGRDCAGRSLLEICPTVEPSGMNWPAVFGRVLAGDERIRVTDLPIRRGGDGAETAIVDINAFPVQWGERRFVAIVLRDVTEKLRSQHELRRAEAMEATITLARGVAHDFSGLLTTAIGSLSVLTSEIGNGHPGELARRALRACGQAVGLSRTLLSFAGGERGDPEPLPLRETVRLITESLDEAELAKIDLQLELQDVTAFIDRDQFTEIVLNLVRNACEAMPDGGTLYIRLEPSKLPGVVNTEGPPTHALLTVSDTGPGISAEVRQRLFEPFFTTKAGGEKRSRGMGLSVVYAAVKNAGGTIEIDSNAPGATFRIWLPFPDHVNTP